MNRFRQIADGLWVPVEDAATSTAAGAPTSPMLESMVETFQAIEPVPPAPEFIFKGSREQFLEAFESMVGKAVEKQSSGVLPPGQPSSVWSGVTVHFCPPNLARLVEGMEKASDTLATALLSEKQVRLRWLEHASRTWLFPAGRTLRKCQLRRITRRRQAAARKARRA